MKRWSSHRALALLLIVSVAFAAVVAVAQVPSQSPYSGFTNGSSCSPNSALSYNGNSFVACTSGAWAVQPVTIGTASGAPATCNAAAEGMLYFDTGSTAVKVCTGSSWAALLSGAALGTQIPAAGSTGDVQFNSSGALAGSNNLYWNNTSGFLGIWTTTPQSLLYVGNGNPIQASPTLSNYGLVTVQASGQYLVIGADSASPYEQWIQSRGGGYSLPLSLNPAGGYVGIGTANPMYQFDDHGGDAGIDYGLAIGYSYYGTPPPYSGLIVGGDVGIGTASPVNDLDVYGSMAIGSYAGANVAGDGDLIVSGAVGIGTTNPQTNLDVNGPAEIYNGATIGWGAGVNGPYNGLIVDSQVGIGTSIPQSSFDVNGSAEIYNGATIGWGAGVNGPYNGLIVDAQVGIGTSIPQSSFDVNGSAEIYNGAAVGWGAGVNGPYNGLTVAGQIGIGTTSPQSQLDVSGGAEIYDNAAIGWGAGVNGPFDGLTVAGQVGIGTTNPQSQLDVSGGAEIYDDAAIGWGAGVNGPFDGLTVYGYVGIGTATPVNDLDIYGSMAIGSYAGVNIAGDGDLIISGQVGVGSTAPIDNLNVVTSSSNVNGAGITIQNTNSGSAAAITVMNDAGNVLDLQMLGSGFPGASNVGVAVTSASAFEFLVDGNYSSGGSDPLLFTTGGYANSPTMTITAGNPGDVGIGNTSPSYILDVSGQARFTGGYTTSDRRWKANIEPLRDSLSLVSRLQGVSFDWKRKEFPKMHFAEGKQIGFIAQDVEKILPAIVSTDKDGYKNLSYESITPVLVEAVKELKADNDNLRAQLKAANDNFKVQTDELRLEVDELRQQVHAR
jgi:hypothetical protein